MLKAQVLVLLLLSLLTGFSCARQQLRTKHRRREQVSIQRRSDNCGMRILMSMVPLLVKRSCDVSSFPFQLYLLPPTEPPAPTEPQVPPPTLSPTARPSLPPTARPTFPPTAPPTASPSRSPTDSVFVPQEPAQEEPNNEIDEGTQEEEPSNNNGDPMENEQDEESTPNETPIEQDNEGEQDKMKMNKRGNHCILFKI